MGRSVHNLLPESMTRTSFTLASPSIFMAIFLMGLSLTVGAQHVDYSETRTAKQILDSYDTQEEAWMRMTRAEWAVVSKSPEHNQEDYLTFLRSYHDSFEEERVLRKELRMQKVLEDDDCGCWVEPDDSYISLVGPPGAFGLGPNEEEWEYEADWGAAMLVDVASAAIPINEPGVANPWSFDLYGAEYDFFHINSNGQISFGGYVLDWNPVGFPAAGYNQIAGYWADTDLRGIGEIKYKVTPQAVYVNYIDVGHYNNKSDKTNSFQIILTDPSTGILPEGSNAQVCYLEMGWAHGDFDGGSNGCCGNTPGITGADGEDTDDDVLQSPHVQFGRFNFLNDTYNGPYGAGPDEQDGVYWLNNKKFNINTAQDINNLNPVATANLGCDTVRLCLGQEYSLDINFLGPEPQQTVSLVVEENIAGNTILNASQSDGEQAFYTGTFVANEPGISTIAMTAEDNLSGTTEVFITIEVLDVEPPGISVVNSEGGDEFGMCAGNELQVVASAVGGGEGIESWSWNLNSQFWVDNVADIPFGGTFVVTGTTSSGCVVKEAIDVVQTPFYLPTVLGANVTLCPGETTELLIVPDDDQVFVEYEWVPNWGGGGGDVVEGQGTDAAVVTPGLYQVRVIDAGGCEGRYTFPISESSVAIPDLDLDPVCEGSPDAGFAPVVLEGGYSSPESGYYITQLFSTTGWNGAFLEIQVISPDTTTSALLTTGNTFEPIPASGDEDQWPELAIQADDSVLVIFNSAGDTLSDQTLSVKLFNCVGNCNGENAGSCLELTDFQDGDTLYFGPALCSVQPALGTWSVTSGQDSESYSFSTVDEFNTVFTPGDFGFYELCFEDEECLTPHCYELEVSLPPAIELGGDSILWVCGDDILDLEAFVTDPGGQATINWPYPGEDNVLANDYEWDQYFSGTLSVNVQNGCGEDDDAVEVTAIQEPDLGDVLYVCGDTEGVELDPIDGDQFSDLVYQWTYNGNVVDDVQDNEWTVSASGSYCVIVPSENCPNSFDENDCALVDIVLPIDVEVFSGGATTDCDGGGIEAGAEAVLSVSSAFVEAYADYTITWPDGTVTTEPFEWILPDEEDNPYNGTVIAVLIQDPYGCEPQTDSAFVFIGDVPTWRPLPEYDGVLTLCEGQPETFDLNAEFNGPEYSDYSWTVQCTDTLLDFSSVEDVADLEYNMFPEECREYDLVLLAEIANPCLPEGLAHEFDIKVQNCEIEPVNVFSPQTTAESNPSFWIKGLEPWEDDPEGVFVQIFDRWGNKVYENNRYRNASANWNGEGNAPGVYFYTIILPNGEEHTGTVNIFR